MKLYILSDLHMEMSKFEPPATDADVIVLAGDIAVGNKGVYWAREIFPNKPIVYVPGNHEFYGSRRPETLSLLRIAGKQNGVQVLDTDEFIFDGEFDSVRFLGCTLWTDFQLFGAEKKASAISSGQYFLNDFRVITEVERDRFTPVRSIELHEQSIAWLAAKLDEQFDGKTVVVTHHLPSMQSVATRFQDDIVSACFASELDYMFGKMKLWVHGHMHNNCDYEVNGTRVICNPRGYVTMRGMENFDFNPALVVEV